MNREEAKHLLEVLKAYSEGKTVQFKVFKDSVEPWKEINDSKIEELIYNKVQLRIKPEPKLRPYKNTEEFLNAQKEHGLYIGPKNDNILHDVWIVEGINDNGVLWSDIHSVVKSFTFQSLLEKYVWADGTPCGVVEE